MNINGLETTATQFAYDGCHKIYLLENVGDAENASATGYGILPIEDLEDVFNNSCPLRFISDWALRKTYVAQFEDAEFTDEGDEE